MAKKGNKTGIWAKQHINDPYVKKATSQGYRSRAVYKLQEIDEQDQLIKPGMVIVDLGAAPGGWLQYTVKKITGSGKLIGIDLLKMEPVSGANLIQGDFQDEDVLSQLDELLENQKVDLVISDMAPNITGIRSVDEAAFEGLLDSVFYFCEKRLKKNGNLLVKLFEGSAAHYFRREVKKRFVSGVVRKPKASRSKSKEFYFLAKKYKAAT